MNPELLTYRGPIWDFPYIEWILPCILALTLTLIIVPLISRYESFRERRSRVALYVKRIQDLDLSGQDTLHDLSLLLREYLDRDMGHAYNLTSSGSEVRLRAVHQFAREWSDLMDRAEYA
jgi:hypothetical protein